MNTIAIIIFVALIADFIISTIAEILNLKVLRETLPEAFRGVYDEEKYQKSQEYLKTNTRFGWIQSVASLLVILAIWFGRGFPILDNWIGSLDFGPLISGLFYIGVLVFVKSTISLPFSIYATFVIEKRFGFNTTTWPTFIKDIFKSVILSLLIGTPIVAVVLAFFEFAGSNAWWLCWLAVSIVMLGLQYIVPTWIMPLFNKFEPLEENTLKDAIMSYAASINFPLKHIMIMDGSKRSKKSNAFFTGFGRNKRVVLFDTLVEQHNISELLAILAHEMGHYKKRHIIYMTVAGIIQAGFTFYLLSLFISYQGLFEAFYMKTPSVYAGLIFFGMLYAPIDFFTGLLIQLFSRRNEYAADAFAVTTTRDKKNLIEALKKLSVNNLSNLLPHPLFVLLNYSHPPILERIQAIEAVDIR